MGAYETKKFYRHFWSEDSMIAGTGFEKKNEPTRFPRSPLDGGVGHVLVLVFAATRRHLALRAARVIERAGRHVEFFEIRFEKALYTV